MLHVVHIRELQSEVVFLNQIQGVEDLLIQIPGFGLLLQITLYLTAFT